MRWQRLFDDLEAQLDGEVTEAIDAELADRIRGELAKTSIEDRLRGSLGGLVTLELAGAGSLRGTVRRVGADWLIIDETGATSTIVLIAAVSGARGLAVAARGREVDGTVTTRIGISGVLRVLARDRTPTAVVRVAGSRLAGTITRVGADYFDLAEHAVDEPRGPGSTAISRTVPVSAVATLRPFY